MPPRLHQCIAEPGVAPGCAEFLRAFSKRVADLRACVVRMMQRTDAASASVAIARGETPQTPAKTRGSRPKALKRLVSTGVSSFNDGVFATGTQLVFATFPDAMKVEWSCCCKNGTLSAARTLHGSNAADPRPNRRRGPRSKRCARSLIAPGHAGSIRATIGGPTRHSKHRRTLRPARRTPCARVRRRAPPFAGV